MCIYFLHLKGQVDWAALAQAWIAQKESTGSEPPNIQPNGQDIPGLEPVGQSNHGAFQGDPAFGRMWQPGMSLTSGIVTSFYILLPTLSSLPSSFAFLYWKLNGNWSASSVLTYSRLFTEIVWHSLWCLVWLSFDILGIPTRADVVKYEQHKFLLWLHLDIHIALAFVH